MKYFYQKSDIAIPIYGERITLDHPVYLRGTLYFEDGKGLIVTQLRFDILKTFYWDALEAGLANDIYLNKNFSSFFSQNATEKDYPIFQVRKIMWALRMKPLPKEDWEFYI